MIRSCSWKSKSRIGYGVRFVLHIVVEKHNAFMNAYWHSEAPEYHYLLVYAWSILAERVLWLHNREGVHGEGSVCTASNNLISVARLHHLSQ